MIFFHDTRESDKDEKDSTRESEDEYGISEIQHEVNNDGYKYGIYIEVESYEDVYLYERLYNRDPRRAERYTKHNEIRELEENENNGTERSRMIER